MSQTHSDVPQPSVRRLSQYLRQLESLHAQGQPKVSSRSLAASLDLTDAQVRKDLAYFGQFGRPGVGYEVGPLIHRLRSILGTDRVSYTLLVGVGNIGRALARYQGFKSKGFELVALFDADPKKVGRKIGSMPIQPMEELESVVAQWGVRLAILAVPAETAQSVVDRLARTGLRGILNFAPTRLKAPAGVTVHNLDVAAELEQLSYMANHSTASQA
jgi:redox-sensing transcriptional repressor